MSIPSGGLIAIHWGQGRIITRPGHRPNPNAKLDAGHGSHGISDRGCDKSGWVPNRHMPDAQRRCAASRGWASMTDLTQRSDGRLIDKCCGRSMGQCEPGDQLTSPNVGVVS